MKNKLTNKQIKMINLAKNFSTKLEKMLDRAICGSKSSYKGIHGLLSTGLSINDIADLQKYCMLIVSEQFTEAAKLQLFGMDSLIKEMIPFQLDRLIENHWVKI